VNSIGENTRTSFCRNCQVRQSVSGLQKLINKDDMDNENHFRSSIYIHVNQIKIP
jgi:hypothetical protein